MPNNSRAILFFDGVCNLCNTTVDFVLDRDRSGEILFSSLQSEFAKQFLGNKDVDTDDLFSVIFWRDGKLYFKSRAAMEIGKQMGGFWRLLAYMGHILPPFIRDALYDWVAKNRYKWFGQRETCRLAKPGEKARFLEKADDAPEDLPEEVQLA